MSRGIRLSRCFKEALENITVERYVPHENRYQQTLTNLKAIIEPRTTAGVDEEGAILLDRGYVATITPPIKNLDEIQPDDSIVRKDINNRNEQRLFIADITNLRGVQQLILSSEHGEPAQ